jgi:hypothetical protein
MRLQQEIDVEGDMLEGEVNPKHKLIETLSRRSVALSRMLHVHAQATVGRSEDAAKALELERQAATDDDDLIPNLRMVR